MFEIDMHVLVSKISGYRSKILWTVRINWVEQTRINKMRMA